MENNSVSALPPLTQRLLIAIPLFSVFVCGYGFVYMLGVGMMMWDPSKIWERHPVIWYYMAYFWPAVMLFWSVAPPVLVLKGKNWKWWLVAVAIGIASVFFIFCGFFALCEFYDK